MPFKSEKQRKWMYANEPEMAKDWEKKNEGPQKDRNELALYMIELNKMLANAKILQKRKDPKAKIYIKMIQQDLKDAKKKMAKLKESMTAAQSKAAHKKFKETGELPPHLKKLFKDLDKVKTKHKVTNVVVPGLEWMSKLGEAADRDYKAEYKKFQSSTKAKKYRAELNKYNRKKGTYGNGDGKDASHKGGKIVGFEKESVNRGRAEKSRLKKEANMPDFNPMIDKALDEVIEEYTMSRKGVIDKIATLAKANRYGTVDGTQMNGKSAKEIIAIYNHPKMKRFKKAMDDYTVDDFVNLSIKLKKVLGIKVESVNEAGMELKKLEDAIKFFKKKIEKQGRVTNARDEEHLERLMKVYNDMGGRKIKENNELFEWLQEACWKGYEKKGMKTMFGKRYPNCVKKTKKEGVDEGTTQKFSSAKIDKAIKIAKSMGGNMTNAVKKIEKIEKNLSKNGRVEYALQQANESINEAAMELNKIKDAILMFQKKIKKQGMVTNARDEEHLKKLIKLYKQMGGKGVKEGIGDKFAKKINKHGGTQVKGEMGKGVQKILKIADSGYGKVGGTTVDGMSANLFKQIYNKANDDIKQKLNTKNEKQLVRIIGGMWQKFGKNVKIGSSL